jgi:23S rRNA (guanosine2251-2'-O)-methyltransferase
MARKHNERYRGKTEITVFGRRAVMEALSTDLVDVRRVMVAQTERGRFRDELLAGCAAREIELEEGTPQEVSRITGEPRHDQGVVARIELRSVNDAEAYAQSVPRASRLLALDNVTNPQNVGMIVRSVVAAGMGGMLWPLAGTPWVSGLIIKASASTVYRCPILTTPTLADGLVTMRRAGFALIGLTAGAKDSLFDHKPPQRAVYVVGGETEGISTSVEALLDGRLAIPMKGGVESLNAAVAASLVCFHARGG